MPQDATSSKSAKELAYLHDLYIATDWSERFAKIVDEHLQLPEEGQVLYVECGTGNHALELREKLNETVDFYCTESDEERLRIAQAKAQAIKANVHFQNSYPHALNFPEATFTNVICDASFLGIERLLAVWQELHRVTELKGNVGFVLPTAGSFGEFFSILWEALQNLEMNEMSDEVERLISNLPKISDLEDVVRNAGFQEFELKTSNEIFEFEVGQEFLRSPLISDFLFPIWTSFVPSEKHVKLLREIEKTIDESRDQLSFQLSVKMTLITTQKL